MIAWHTNIYYFSFFNITRHGYIYRFNICHIGCSLDYHSYLGKLVFELQVNRSIVACIVCRSPQHIHQAVNLAAEEQCAIRSGIPLAAEEQCAIRSGIPGSDLGRLGVLPIDGLIGFHCDISRIIHLYYIYARFLIVADAHAYPFPALEYAAAAVGLLGHARPRLLARLRGDAYTAYLQGVFAVGQGVALLGQFVLRAGGEQDCRHEAYCCK